MLMPFVRERQETKEFRSALGFMIDAKGRSDRFQRNEMNDVSEADPPRRAST